MPAGRVFLDSNIFLYGRAADQSAKTIRASEWLRSLAASGTGCTNLQVLNEVTHVLLRKRRDLSEADIFRQVDALRFFGDAALGRDSVLHARRIREMTRYSWWDCLLLASALELGCSYFLSEDLQDGQVTSGGGSKGLTIVDPFAHSPDTFFPSR